MKMADLLFVCWEQPDDEGSKEPFFKKETFTKERLAKVPPGPTCLQIKFFMF